MMRRFLAASGSCAVLVAGAALMLLLVRPVPLERATVPLLLWCFAPAVWGLWAMLAPRSVALPLWGALLGLLASSLSIFALHLPQRILALPLSLFVRLLAVALVTLLYFVAWSAVQIVDEWLQPPPAAVKAHGDDTAEQVAIAHDLLVLLRGESEAHPQVEEAIRRLELALANLTVRTSALL